MIKKINVYIATIFCIVLLTGIPSYAALTVSNEALAALDYQNVIIQSLNTHINFYEIGVSFIGPSPLTGYSVIKGTKTDTAYSKIFEDINEKNKNARKQKKPELWEDMIKSKEPQSIKYLVDSLSDTGKAIWEGWPNIAVPGAKDNSRFSIEPQELKFIVPSFAGVLIGSSSRFDESMHDYLVQAKAFYPIITLKVPIPQNIEKNKYREMIYANIMANVPGSNIENAEIVITIFPELDSMNGLIQTSREIMAGESGSSKGQ